MRRLFASSAAAIVITALSGFSARPCRAAVESGLSFGHVAKAWMGAVALLAQDDDGDRGDRPHGGKRSGDDGDRESRREGRPGHGGHHGHHRGHHRGHAGGPGPRPGMEGPRVVMAKMDEILDRLTRIEAKLDGRAGGPPRGEWRGPRPEGRPEMPAEAREQMRKRMEEGRERMEQARQKFREMEERISKLEAEIERLKNPKTVVAPQ